MTRWDWAGRARALTPKRWVGASVHLFFYVCDIDVLVRDARRAVPAVSASGFFDLRRIAQDDAVWWRDVFPSLRRRQQIARFLNDGDVGWVALVDSKQVGEIWLTRRSKRGPAGIRVWLGPRDAYAGSLRTSAAHRRLGIGPALVSAMLREAASSGDVDRVYCFVDRNNRPSQVMLRFLGFRCVQRARRARIRRVWGFVVPGSVRPIAGPLSAFAGLEEAASAASGAPEVRAATPRPPRA